MNETTKNFLGFDAIATSETLLHKHHEDWSSEDKSAVLKFVIATNQVKNAHLKSIGDTHFGISWIEFIEILKAYGFKESYCKKFTNIDFCNYSTEEEEIIYFHEEKGLILHAESYRKIVNKAKVYGEVKVGESLNDNQLKAMNGCSHVYNDNGTMQFSVDVREGFRFHLDAISEAFEFSKNWTKVRFIWFLNSMDYKIKNYDYEEINNLKINACTPEVRRIIFG